MQYIYTSKGTRGREGSVGSLVAVCEARGELAVEDTSKFVESCLIFEHICSVTAVVSDPQIILIQSQIQIQGCNSVIEEDNLTNIPDEDRDGMQTTQDP